MNAARPWRVLASCPFPLGLHLSPAQNQAVGAKPRQSGKQKFPANTLPREGGKGEVKSVSGIRHRDAENMAQQWSMCPSAGGLWSGGAHSTLTPETHSTDHSPDKTPARKRSSWRRRTGSWEAAMHVLQGKDQGGRASSQEQQLGPVSHVPPGHKEEPSGSANATPLQAQRKPGTNAKAMRTGCRGCWAGRNVAAAFARAATRTCVTGFSPTPHVCPLPRPASRWAVSR